MKSNSFIDKEAQCRFIFDQNGPYWHIATPGNLTEVLFTSPDEYRFGVSLAAICAMESGMKVYAFEIMSNHLHEIAGAPSPDICIHNLQLYSRRLKRWAAKRGRHLALPENFVCDPLPIENLQSLRNSIVYSHRNNYVIDSSQTPFSYPWGSGILYFGPDVNALRSTKFSDLSYNEQRLITCSRRLSLPSSITVRNGCISPESFCDWKTGRAFFRDAHQYLNMLTKNYEANAEFSALLGDTVILTDEEMYSAAYSLARQQYNAPSPAQLPDQLKQDLARKLHFDFRAGNNQLRRILKMNPSVLEAMFPTPR